MVLNFINKQIMLYRAYKSLHDKYCFLIKYTHTLIFQALNNFRNYYWKVTFAIQVYRKKKIWFSRYVPCTLLKDIFRFWNQNKNHQSDTKWKSLKHNVSSNGWMIVFGLLKLWSIGKSWSHKLINPKAGVNNNHYTQILQLSPANFSKGQVVNWRRSGRSTA